MTAFGLANVLEFQPNRKDQFDFRRAVKAPLLSGSVRLRSNLPREIACQLLAGRAITCWLSRTLGDRR